MSRFYATVVNHEGSTVTKGCSERLMVHICGWDVGVRVTVGKDDNPELGIKNDRILIELTGGSNRPNKTVQIGEFVIEDLGKVFQLVAVPVKQKGE